MAKRKAKEEKTPRVIKGYWCSRGCPLLVSGEARQDFTCDKLKGKKLGWHGGPLAACVKGDEVK